MAQKRSRTRGCHGLRLAAALSLLCMVASAALAAEPPLAAAQKALKAGKPEVAVNALSAALAGAGLKGGDVARAYYLRGTANAKAGNTAAAIADFNHALWLKGLTDTERQEALAAKASLYKRAGLAAPDAEPAPQPEVVAEAPKPEKPAAKKIPVAEPVAEAVEVPIAIEPAAAETSKWDVKTTAAKSAPVKAAAMAKRKKKAGGDAAPAAETMLPLAEAGREDLPWSGAAVAQADPAAKPTATVVADDNPVSSVLGTLFSGPPKAEPATTSADASQQVASAEPAAESAPAQPVAAGKATAKTPKAGVYLQVASLRSPKDADAFAARLKTEQAALLASIGTCVIPVVVGNMGTFYAVHVGPVASAAAGAGLCKKLTLNGVDCFIATP